MQRNEKALVRIGRLALTLVVVAVIASALFIGYGVGAQVEITSRVTTTQTKSELITQAIVELPFTQTVTTLESLPVYNSPGHTFLVDCCPDLPSSFVIGNYSFQAFEFAPMPCTVLNGTEECPSAGALLVFNVTHDQQSQNVSFTWGGTFSETVPYPDNATAFKGAVSFLWFVNSTKLYLTIGTNPVVNSNITCTFSGEPDGVMVHLLLSDSNGSALSGVQIHGYIATACNGVSQIFGLQPATTNSSGWTTFRDVFPGNYNLALNYSGEMYTFTVPARPTVLTIATYRIPSGSLSVRFCQFGNLSLCSTNPQ